ADSTLQFVKQLINIRRQHSAFTLGESELLPTLEPVLAYLRSDANDSFMVVMNISKVLQSIDLNSLISDRSSESAIQDFDVIISTEMDNSTMFDPSNGRLNLRPHEGVIMIIS
ncbi:MAG TPA: hypothetical protein VJ915_00200, partial [Balneolaceae bacterium]|nr:hypothetical protein [Balneolaceae bacterium]